MKFEEREQINRTCDEVYLAISRPDLYLASWSRGVLSVSVVANAAGDDLTRYKIVGRDLVGKAHWHYEVTSLEPGKAFAARVKGGPVPFTESFSLRSLSDR